MDKQETGFGEKLLGGMVGGAIVYVIIALGGSLLGGARDS